MLFRSKVMKNVSQSVLRNKGGVWGGGVRGRGAGVLGAAAALAPGWGAEVLAGPVEDVLPACPAWAGCPLGFGVFDLSFAIAILSLSEAKENRY